MTQPIGGAYTVTCWECKSQVYASDTAPPDDAQALLTAFADSRCPKNGLECPNTTTAVTERDEQRPARLRHWVRTIRERAPRTRRMMLPDLVAATPVEITVSWPTPLPDAGYAVTVELVAGPALLGRIQTSIKPGSLTTTECTLLVATTRDVAAGLAGLHVVAVP